MASGLQYLMLPIFSAHLSMKGFKHVSTNRTKSRVASICESFQLKMFIDGFQEENELKNQHLVFESESGWKFGSSDELNHHLSAGYCWAQCDPNNCWAEVLDVNFYTSWVTFPSEGPRS